MIQRRSFLVTASLAALFLLGAAQFTKQKKTHLGGLPSGLVRLTAIANQGVETPLSWIDSEGTVIGSLMLPPHSVLIVTDMIVSVNGDPQAGVTRGGLVHAGSIGSEDPYYSFDTTKQASQGIHLTSGVVWSHTPVVLNSGDSKNSVFVNVYGYIAKDT